MIGIRALGPVEVTVDGRGAPAELLWRKNLALLVYLARSPKRARTREHLIGLLWSDKPEAAARHSLNEAIRVLRRHLGDDAMDTDGGQVRLGADAVELDTERLDALIAGQKWSDAAALVSGEFLEGLSISGASDFEDWLTAERALWRRRGVDALVRWAEVLLAAGDVSRAAEAAHRALGLDPVSAVAARAAMRAMALAGDRAGALELYDRLVRRLKEELGAEPDVESKALADRVRRERAWRVSGAGASPAAAAPSRRAPLVGRDAELARLLESWKNCVSERRATLAVIEGESGAGKTRLAEELLARARLDGAATVTVRAVEADHTDPGSGLLALAGEHAGLLDAPGLAAAPPEALAAFAPHSAAWADRFAAAIRGAKPAALGRALSGVLHAVTGEQPVVLVFDDAQWLDHDSMLALEAALRDGAAERLMLVLTIAAQPARAELDELRARIGREVPGVALRVTPLDSEGLKNLARWSLPNYSAVDLDRLTRRVMMDSAGLPLLAVELLHAVTLGLDLREARGAWPEESRTLDQSLPGELPDAVLAAVRVGFRRLSKNAQQVLIAAAVIGGRVAPDQLRRATQLAETDLAEALDELEWQRWLTAEPRGYAFVARIVREIVATDMVTAGQKQRILAAGTGAPPPAGPPGPRSP
jgi:DNA-binding SARP family transcriptional activator